MEEKKNPIQVADKIFLVMETLAQNGPMGLMEIAAQLDLNKTTAHRVLSSLHYVGYVSQNPENSKYSLTLKILDLSNKVLEKMDILDITAPYLRQLMESSGETVHVVQLDGVHAVYINKMESDDNSLRLVSRIGKRIPLYCSGVGKALLADMDDEKIHKIWLASDVRKLTENTITDWEIFSETIRKIRRDGFAVDHEENEIGVRCVAIALENHDPNTSYAISISGPASRMTDAKTDALAKRLLEIKKQIGPI